MSRSRNDFYCSYDAAAIKAARENAGYKPWMVAYKAGIPNNVYCSYEREEVKRASGDKAAKIASALGCNVCDLFPDYDDRKVEFEEGLARKLTSAEKEHYAEELIGLVRFFVNEDIALWGGDFEEGLSEALLVFWDVLNGFKKPQKDAAVITALRACVKVSLHYSALKFYKKQHAAEVVSLEAPALRDDEDGKDIPRSLWSPYNVEDYVIAREELRYRLRHADPETRRIATIELDL